MIKYVVSFQGEEKPVENAWKNKKVRIAVIAGTVATLAIIVMAVVSFIVNSKVDGVWRGNTASNIANEAMFVEAEDGTIYFNRDGLFKMTPDGEVQRLTDYIVSSLCIDEQYLYYSYYNDTGKLYRMNLETQEHEKISDIACGSLNLVDGVLYHSSQYLDSQKGIYKTYQQEDGTFTTEQITIDHAGNLIYYNDRLFFINNADFNRVYSMKLDGSDRQAPVGRGTSMFTIENGWIYYCNKNGMYKCKPDGSAQVQLVDLRVSDMNVTEDYIYYSYYSASQTDANQQFYRVDLDGKNREMISSDSAIGICTAGDYIYFQNGYKKQELYRVSKDNKVYENATEVLQLNRK